MESIEVSIKNSPIGFTLHKNYIVLNLFKNDIFWFIYFKLCQEERT